MNKSLFFLAFFLIFLSFSIVSAHDVSDCSVDDFDNTILSSSDSISSLGAMDYSASYNNQYDSDLYVSGYEEYDNSNNDCNYGLDSDDNNLKVADLTSDYNNQSGLKGSEIFINDSNYDTYFDDNEMLIAGMVSGDDVLVIGNISNKNLIFNQTVHIDGKGTGKVLDGTVILYPGASGSSVNDLTVEYNYATKSILGLICCDTDGGDSGVNNILLSNNRLYVCSTSSNNVYSACGVLIYGNEDKYSRNITVVNNTIVINADNYIARGVSVYGNSSVSKYTFGDKKIASDIYVYNNNISLKNSGNVESIRLDNIEDSVIVNNSICSFSNNGLYGFSIKEGNNLKIENNSVNCTGDTKSYGFLLYYCSNNSVISNDIFLNSSDSYGINSFISNYNVIHWNNFTVYGVNLSYCYYSLGSSNASLKYNSISLNGYSKSNVSDSYLPLYVGVLITDLSYNTTVKYNYISSFSENGDNYAVYINVLNTTVNYPHEIIYNNLLSQSGTVTGDDACFVNNGTNNITVLYNTPSSNYTEDLYFVFDENPIFISSGIFNAGLRNFINHPVKNRNVTATFNNETYTQTTDDNGNVSFNISSDYSVTDYLTLYFSGDKTYNPSSNTTNLSIITVDGDMSLKISSSSIILGMSTDLILSLPDNASGNISIYDNNQSIYTVSNESYYTDHSNITLTYTPNTTGEHIITIVYSGDDNYQSSKSNALLYVNTKLSTDLQFSPITANFASSKSNYTTIFNITLKDSNSNPLSSKKIYISYDGTVYTATTNSNGIAQLTLNIQSNSSDTITVAFLGDENYDGSFNISKITIIPYEKKATQLIFDNMTTTVVLNNARNGKYFIVTLKDSDGKALPDKTIHIGFNGKVYKKTTNSAGQAQLQINIGYKSANTFAITFLGDDDYQGNVSCAIIVVNTANSKLTASSYSYKSSAKTKTLKATLKLSNGTAISGKQITFLVNGQYYIATTNSKGVATVKISLTTKKTYYYTATFNEDFYYSKSTATAKVIIK